MPFVVMALLGVGVTVWLFALQPRRTSAAQGGQSSGEGGLAGRSPAIDAPMSIHGNLVGVRGWLFVYVTGLGLQALHDLGLSVAALIIDARPSLARLTSLVPLPQLLFYVVSNIVIVAYTVALYVLMVNKRKSAVANNVICNALAVAFLGCWHLLGMKSAFGAVVDSLPSVVGVWYILASRRVRNTFTLT